MFPVSSQSSPSITSLGIWNSGCQPHPCT